MIVAECRRWRRVAGGCLMLVTVAMLAGCSVGAREQSDRDARQSQPVPVDERREILDRERQAPSPQRAALPESRDAAEAQGAGEVPQRLLAIFKEDLARRALVKEETISVISAVQEQWPDGSLGCPKPGQFYTQAIVPGYRVTLSAAGRSYAYHSDMRGLFVVCLEGVPSAPMTQQMRDKPAQ